MSMTLHCESALLPAGWANQVSVTFDANGRITAVTESTKPDDRALQLNGRVLLPAMANLHSHTFQRAMAGLTEQRGPDVQDSFWTWRSLMYRFLLALDPNDVEAIAAQAFVEMLESGYASVAEFHYVHHRPDGGDYDDIAETSSRVASAAKATGIGLTHLPVMYNQGGADGSALADGQCRFGCDLDRFQKLAEAAANHLTTLPNDCRSGIAPHSLRAVAMEDLTRLVEGFEKQPIHIHIAEQTAEIGQIQQIFGIRPVELLFDRVDVDNRWCLIHATHMSAKETQALAKSGAVAGLCPITEANLGDGVFNGLDYHRLNGEFGIGTDSNVCISLIEELRQLEYSQRLHHRQRVIMANSDKSTGRTLFECTLEGGAKALGRQTGAIAVGNFADLVALDKDNLALAGAKGDRLLDRWMFAGNQNLITDVWSAGRHIVQYGRHISRYRIEQTYRKSLAKLLA